MADRRQKSIWLPNISLGNVLTIVGGLVIGGAWLVTFGVWKGAVDTKIDAQHETLRTMGRKLDDLSTTVGQIDGKLTALMPVKHADAMP